MSIMDTLAKRHDTRNGAEFAVADLELRLSGGLTEAAVRTVLVGPGRTAGGVSARPGAR